ncbi:MAG TPA: hypothetical protein VHZ97_00035, partial [Pseudonocardiaceae bacterium]|nr:hypothetical protein [Pseudonocardiaceae bacterium]
MLESVPTRVPLDELPDSIRAAGLTNWFREPLADAVDQRRRLLMPAAVAVLGTPAAEFDETLSDQAERADTIAMMGDNPALATMPERPTLADFFRKASRRTRRLGCPAPRRQLASATCAAGRP